jgi:hypothetical protein
LDKHLPAHGIRTEKEQFSAPRLYHLLRLTQIADQKKADFRQLIVFALLVV